MTGANKQRKSVIIKEGVSYFPEALTPLTQRQLSDKLDKILTRAPLFKPTMPRTGKPFSVAMSNCGPLGWLSDKIGGYRYEPNHPNTSEPWPPIPDILIKQWTQLTGCSFPPQACLINYYNKSARMGLHRDDDENEPDAPILSISLGDSAWFRIGGLKRKDPTSRILLKSGDIISMSGPARFIYHGIDRILPDTSSVIKNGGRINLTLRRVNPI